MDDSLHRYAENRRKKDAAESYSTKYERYWHKRRSDARERAVIARALSLVAPPQRILDMPCGAGRLTEELLRFDTAEIHACDYSEEQLKICGERHKNSNVTCQRASCFELPFPDDHFDLSFSVRLSHHIGSREDRERYLVELLRVSRQNVVATFFDTHSFKNRLRELRRRVRATKKRSKFTMSRDELHQIATNHDWRVEAAIPISRLFSGHRYVVFSRS